MQVAKTSIPLFLLSPWLKLLFMFWKDCMYFNFLCTVLLLSLFLSRILSPFYSHFCYTDWATTRLLFWMGLSSSLTNAILCFYFTNFCLPILSLNCTKVIPFLNDSTHFTFSYSCNCFQILQVIDNLCPLLKYINKRSGYRMENNLACNIPGEASLLLSCY